MTDSAPEPFRPPSMQRLINDLNSDELAQLDEAQFEDEIVALLLTRYGLSHHKKAMLDAHAAQFGRKQLTLDAFHERFNFPIRLFARKFRKIAERNPVHRFFTDFGNRDFTKSYLELRQTLGDEQQGMATGLVFFWPFIKGRSRTEERGSGLVLHNWGHLRKRGTRFQWTATASGDSCVLEPFMALLAAIDKQHGGAWQPDE